MDSFGFERRQEEPTFDSPVETYRQVSCSFLSLHLYVSPFQVRRRPIKLKKHDPCGFRGVSEGIISRTLPDNLVGSRFGILGRLVPIWWSLELVLACRSLPFGLFLSHDPLLQAGFFLLLLLRLMLFPTLFFVVYIDRFIWKVEKQWLCSRRTPSDVQSFNNSSSPQNLILPTMKRYL